MVEDRDIPDDGRSPLRQDSDATPAGSSLAAHQTIDHAVIDPIRKQRHPNALAPDQGAVEDFILRASDQDCRRGIIRMGLAC